LFRPIRSNQLFCSAAHKDEFRFRSEGFRRTKDEVLKLVASEVPRLIAQLLPKLTRGVFLALETDPPPALLQRISERVLLMIDGRIDALVRCRSRRRRPPSTWPLPLPDRKTL
jgi:hypothetical protein